MREYRVPFAVSEGESSFVSGLTVRQFLWLVAFGVPGLVFWLGVAYMLRASLPGVVMLSVVGVPFFVAGLMMAFKKVREVDDNVGLDTHLFRTVSYRLRRKDFINF